MQHVPRLTLPLMLMALALTSGKLFAAEPLLQPFSQISALTEVGSRWNFRKLTSTPSMNW